MLRVCGGPIDGVLSFIYTSSELVHTRTDAVMKNHAMDKTGLKIPPHLTAVTITPQYTQPHNDNPARRVTESSVAVLI